MGEDCRESASDYLREERASGRGPGAAPASEALTMPIVCFIPGPLRSFAAGKSEIVIETSPVTLADALKELWKQCPGIRDRVVNEQDQVREHVNVFVGKENVRFTGGLQTPIPEGAEITIMPAISGG